MAWRLFPGLASSATPKTNAARPASPPSHRARESSLVESEATSANANTTLATPAAYSSAYWEILGHASASVPATAEAAPHDDR